MKDIHQRSEGRQSGAQGIAVRKRSDIPHGDGRPPAACWIDGGPRVGSPRQAFARLSGAWSSGLRARLEPQCVRQRYPLGGECSRQAQQLGIGIGPQPLPKSA